MSILRNMREFGGLLSVTNDQKGPAADNLCHFYRYTFLIELQSRRLDNSGAHCGLTNLKVKQKNRALRDKIRTAKHIKSLLYLKVLSAITVSGFDYFVLCFFS